MRRVWGTVSLLLLFLIVSLTLPATPIVRGQTLAPTGMDNYGWCTGWRAGHVVAVNSSVLCFAGVYDLSVDPTAPTGVVTFSACCDPSGAPFSSSSFAPSNTCTIMSGIYGGLFGYAYCFSVNYTPASGTEGPQTITASYAGDSTHSESSATVSFQVTKRGSLTSVSCSPNGIGHTTKCEASVIDFLNESYYCCNNFQITPTGTVAWSNGGPLILKPTRCTLSDTNVTGTATCIATYRGSLNPSYQQITTAYIGDTDHFGSSGNTIAFG